MEKKSFLKGNDYFIFGVVTAVVSILLLISLKDVKHDAAILPEATLIFMLVMSGLMMIDSIIKYMRKVDTSLKVSFAEMAGGVLVPGMILIAASLVIEYLGYYIMTFLLVMAIFMLQSKITNSRLVADPKKILLWLIFSVATTVFMYFIFGMMFRLPTPRGIFGF